LYRDSPCPEQHHEHHCACAVRGDRELVAARAPYDKDRPTIGRPCSPGVLVGVALFIGSSPGPDPHVEAAASFAAELARRKVGIVFGGGRVGLTGVIADDLADAFVALPGGAGTLDELFEAWTWGQLRLHTKPVALFDVDGFYRPLFEQLNAMAAAGYVGPAFLASVGRVSSAADFLQFVADYRPLPSKWLLPAELPSAATGVGMPD
jgi:predicted Rossmann-fold nucleotide-binding protein